MNPKINFNSAAEKHAYVNQMFARIAPRYDIMNRLMSAGQDGRWRNLLVKQLQLPPQGNLLDIATGTGDIAFEAVRQRPDLAQVVGADFTLPMMTIGKNRYPQLQNRQKLSWSGADTVYLPFPDDYFDGVVSGFLMRNVTNVANVLADQTRVCKPGGKVAILEIPRPAESLFGAMFRLYFHNIVPMLGGIISGQPDAYSYLPHSADAFLRPEELKQAMETAGLKNVQYTMLMMGTVALHVGQK
ncbi:bifunctional demethylmenaquinone methyltransferase/2-methoxy-6-polyprenyl-1,4-benzoquinol methylase UbiE [Anaerolineales bacterium HSG6]|nr:bifunctional demethylmenaquinone methyltransferase/2-methoxy-6-polyprenyl-1,4-benzoquinol methylase UbiE [Anaerolineales bacterium HSG6]MDM8530571.1 bifunctional demethylmenaquinone methyltransferase/2-methoxy-6-polyprenyl-1,4-benzoquinol methylase UbiE [Anaerolineales bacterium HSG25]